MWHMAGGGGSTGPPGGDPLVWVQGSGPLLFPPSNFFLLFLIFGPLLVLFSHSSPFSSFCCPSKSPRPRGGFSRLSSPLRSFPGEEVHSEGIGAVLSSFSPPSSLASSIFAGLHLRWPLLSGASEVSGPGCGCRPCCTMTSYGYRGSPCNICNNTETTTHICMTDCPL